MVTFSFRGKSQRSQNLRRTFYRYHRADVEQLNNLILNTDWNNIFHDDWPSIGSWTLLMKHFSAILINVFLRLLRDVNLSHGFQVILNV